MESDPEILEDFIKEVIELKPRLVAAVTSLQKNVNQPEQFLEFAMVIDGIYGTSMTLGFKEIGEYTGIIRQMCRKCGNLKVPRAMPEVFKMMVRCIETCDEITLGLKDPSQTIIIKDKILSESIKAKRLEDEIFAFAKH